MNAPACPVPPHRPGLARSALWATLLTLAALTGCGPDRVSESEAAAEPAQALLLLCQHLRDNRLDAFARDATPPSLRPALEQAWHEGRSRWPLDELPFDHKIPGILGTLATPDAEARLQRTFDQQFRNANRELQGAAATLGLFGMKYLQNDPTLSADERGHFVQLVDAGKAWAMSTRLGDPKRARTAIRTLTRAAQRTGLRGPETFARLGPTESLRRMGPFTAAIKQVLRGYDLDLDQSLDAMETTLVSRDGDHARVRMRYPLGKVRIEAVVSMERVDGHWYLSDYLRHLRALAAPPAGPVPAAPPVPHTPIRGAAPAKPGPASS